MVIMAIMMYQYFKYSGVVICRTHTANMLIKQMPNDGFENKVDINFILLYVFQELYFFIFLFRERKNFYSELFLM